MTVVKRTILDEIKQSRPFRSRSQEATVALLRTTHLLRRRFEALVATEGLTMQQYNVLRILRGAKGPMPTMEISERMIETACGITRLVTTLEEKELVKREQWPGDRRHFLCQITAQGLRLLERLDSPMDVLDQQIAGRLSEEQIENLLELLSEIREQVSDAEAEAGDGEPWAVRARPGRKPR